MQDLLLEENDFVKLLRIRYKIELFHCREVDFEYLLTNNFNVSILILQEKERYFASCFYFENLKSKERGRRRGAKGPTAWKPAPTSL